jgi:hypothetical protein
MAQDLMKALSDLKDRLNSFENRSDRLLLPQGALFWTLTIVIPLTTIVSTHLWLRSAYSSDLFHLQGFLAQYNSGIFRFRMLGRQLLLLIYRVLSSKLQDQPFPMPRDPDATLLFYGSYVALNSICFFFTNLMLLLFLADKNKRMADLRLAAYFFLTLLQALAMAVVTPYDQLAYALIFVGFLAAASSKTWTMYLFLGISAIAGGLNRETEFLVTPALFSIAIFTRGRTSKRYGMAGLYHLALFTITYVGVRILLPGSHLISDGATFGGKWAFESFIALALTFYVGTVLAVRIHPDVRPTIALLILSTPYLLTILLSGILRELRLLIPVLLCQVFVYVQLERCSSRELNDAGRISATA